MSEKFFLIDLNSHLYQAYYAIRELTSPDGEPVNAVFGLARMLQRLIRVYAPDYIAAAGDLPGKVFRHEIYADYKATRKPMPEPLVRQLPLAYEMLEKHEIPLLTAEGYEADDVMGSAARRAAEKGINTVLVTTDKDAEQLIDAHTNVLHIHRNREIMLDGDGLRDKYGLEPRQVVDMLALAGDSSDNIPGASGIGPKTALQLLGRFGSIDNLYANLQEVESDAMRRRLAENREKVELSRRLVVIREDLPLEVDLPACRLDPEPPPELIQFYSALGFRSLVGELAKAQQPAGSGSVSRQGMLFGNEMPAEAAGTDAGADREAVSVSYTTVQSLVELKELAEKMRTEQPFAVDLETTSLDPHAAQIVGIAFSSAVGEGFYVPFMAPEGEKVCPADGVLEILKPLLEDPDTGKIGQNLKYDMMVLFSHGIRLRGIVCDTMIASHLLAPSERSHSLEALSLRHLGLHPIPIEELIGEGRREQRTMDRAPLDKVAKYACEDADLTYRLSEILMPRLGEWGVDEVFRNVELLLIEVLAHMEWQGIRIDSDYMRALSGEMALTLQELEKKIYSCAGDEFNINSPRQLSEILFQRLALPTPRGKKRTTGYSTDRKVLRDLSTEHEIARHLLQWREISKLKSTYADALIDIVNSHTGRLHTSFHQTGTATGRLSSSEPNLQNIPVRTPLGRRIRRGFIPSGDKMSFLSADYSQMELRVLAHCSGDEALRRAFLEDRDIHSFVAAQIDGVAEQDVSTEMRSKAKGVNFGIVYGQTAYGLSRGLGIPAKEAQEFIDRYFGRYNRVRDFIDETISFASRNGYVQTLAGRRRPIRGLQTEGAVRNAAERIAINTVIQGSAADLIKIAMINIHPKLPDVSERARMLVQIHDELLFEVPDADMEEVREFVREQMQGAMDLSVPLKVDFAAGKNWEDAK